MRHAPKKASVTVYGSLQRNIPEDLNLPYCSCSVNPGSSLDHKNVISY